MTCAAETCEYWNGYGCVCTVMDLEPRTWHAVCETVHAAGECPWEDG